MAKVPDPKPEPVKADPNEGLVKVVKDGEALYVHPTTVDAHARVGWRVAD